MPLSIYPSDQWQGSTSTCHITPVSATVGCVPVTYILYASSHSHTMQHRHKMAA